MVWFSLLLLVYFVPVLVGLGWLQLYRSSLDMVCGLEGLL